ncbi:unnamed protein product [Fraxinus pennsylvanica]|uniref:Transmembrane protein n=1 Tax=Fraxinus pennsylvanica TaxID=56036 RepID=A0AAD1Z196_9LAMI|nr:unnamed protein product [Fraxinus pennsylvanica]
MSELCFSSTLKTHFSSLFISDLMISFGSFIFSHPLYFSYLIFLSPYLLKLISFLSPLFITTFLLSLSLLTLIPSFYKKIAIESSSKDDDEHEEFQCMEDLEVYKIVFGESEFEVKGIPVEVLDEKSEVNSSHKDSSSISKSEALTGNLEENSVHMDLGEKVEEKKLGDFLKVLDEFAIMTCNVEGKKVEPTSGTKADESVEISLTRNGSEATDNVGEYTWKVKSSENFSARNLGTYGSMRKEKEWNRTLACKLFEERRNVDGEGMDSLWETYEMDLDKSKLRNNVKKKINIKNKKSVIDVQENDNEEEIDGKLCCLQALKFSAGKMNLGIGRPNVVRNISKAIKGIGWLHTVNRQIKKVHHNGDRY